MFQCQQAQARALVDEAERLHRLGLTNRQIAFLLASDLARQRTNTTGIQFTTDDIVHSAKKIYSFIDKGF